MTRTAKSLLGFGSLAMLVLAVAAWPRPAEWPHIEKLWRVQVIAHRGGLIERPDSTVAAFDHAVAVGSHWLELDIHLSADGVPVVIHDDTVDRTTNGSGPVSKLTLAELRALDAGYRWPFDMTPGERQFGPYSDAYVWRGRGQQILTLEEVLNRYPDHRLLIEIKPPGDEVIEAVMDLIAEHERQGSVLLASFHQQTLASLRRAAPELATVASASEARSFVILSSLGLARFWPRHADVLAIPPTLGERRLLTPRLVRAARSIGVPVYVWTINDEATWDELIDLGVDGILTDRPEALKRHLQQRRQSIAATAGR